MFILPIVFMAIFGLAFGGANKVEFKLGIFQSSSNAEIFDLEKIFNDVDKESDNLIIKTIKYENLQSLRDDLKTEKIDVGVDFSIPTEINSSPKFEVLVQAQDTESTINSTVVSQILTSVVLEGKNPVNISTLDSSKSDFSGFDYLAPGLIIYGLIILIPGIAQSFTEIKEKKYLFRYAVSKVSSFEIIFGSILFYLLLGVIQVVILYGTALAFGYNASGSLAVALVPALLSLLFTISLGLLIGAFFDKSDGATNTGTIVSIILGFFSGSFIYGIGSILKFNIFGNEIQFNDLLPTKWGTIAVEKVLSKNLSLVDIQKEILILSISGIVTILAGVWVYSSRQLKNEI
jgi:ABC-type multidrug transport system permease subunit